MTPLDKAVEAALDAMHNAANCAADCDEAGMAAAIKAAVMELLPEPFEMPKYGWQAVGREGEIKRGIVYNSCLDAIKKNMEG